MSGGDWALSGLLKVGDPPRPLMSCSRGPAGPPPTWLTDSADSQDSASLLMWRSGAYSGSVSLSGLRSLCAALAGGGYRATSSAGALDAELVGEVGTDWLPTECAMTASLGVHRTRVRG